ncbi:MAG TPA: acetolactate synthase small subunit [Candidatus Amulumruptor caecigallinarius]|uniref:Acetolactate synthase small subunit n=1 Tax=Candidatus Amulumruptor caecigallinarius TaxID=2109911 RepID=A0A921E6T7_9BACT|nr:acetolactate synthase small subunit [Candidatus Amulumruptor caecigallinarius]
MDDQLYTITVFTENQVGLLNQISIIFTRRCLNIESMTVSACSIHGVHKFTITCRSNRTMMEHVVKQIERRIDVLRAFLHTDDELVYQEVALYKVPTNRLLQEGHLEGIIRRNGARVLEITDEYTIFEKTGHKSETERLFEELKEFGIRQFVRSGRVAVTKNKTEFVDLFLKEQQARKQRVESKSE